MCLWLERGAHFCKNTKTQCMRANISSQRYLTNRIFDGSSYQDPSVILFFHLVSPKEGPLCSRPTFLRRFLRLHRGGHKAKEKGMIFILIFSNFMKIEIVRKCASHWGRGVHFYKFCKKLKKNHANKHQKSNFLKQVTEIAKINCKLWLQNGLKSKKWSRPSRPRATLTSLWGVWEPL